MRWALPALLALAALLWLDALLGGTWAGQAWALVVVGGVSLAAGLAARPVPLALGVPAAVLLLAVADRVGSRGEFAPADDAVFYAVVVGAPALTGALVAVRTAAVRELESRRAELVRRHAVVVRAARASEVERVERAVDGVLADRLQRIVDGVARTSSRAVQAPGEVPGTLRALEADARAALDLMRCVLGDLRSPAPPPHAPPVQASGPHRGRRVLGQVDALLVLLAVPLVVETSLPGHRGPVWCNVALALGQGVALPVARRRPVAGAATLLALACLQSATLTPLPPTVSWLLPGLALALLVGHAAARRTAWAGLLVILAGACLMTLVTPPDDRSLDGFAPGVLMGVLAWSGGRALAGREARAAELRSIGDELARTRDDAARLATVEQRAELARELHDVGAHTLTVVCLQAGAAQTWWLRDREQALVALGVLEQLAAGVLPSLGASLHGLAGSGPGATLDVVADLGRALGLTVGVHVDGVPRPLTGEVSSVLVRVVQEALTNAARHAQRAEVRVGLVYGADTLEVRVSDDGPVAAGATVVPVPGSGSGLVGMAERVRAVHGDLSCGPRADGGFTVHARLPLDVP